MALPTVVLSEVKRLRKTSTPGRSEKLGPGQPTGLAGLDGIVGLTHFGVLEDSKGAEAFGIFWRIRERLF